MPEATTPEEELLIALAKPHVDEPDLTHAEAALSRPGFSWSEALRISGVHGVQPILAWNLKSLDTIWGRLPKPVRAELATALLIAKMRRSQYRAALAPVFEELRSDGVPFLLMKGAVVMETVYPPDTRLLNDLDVLVPATHRAIAVDIFARSGFRALREAPDPDDYHEQCLVKENGGVRLDVDLHWNVYPQDRPFHFDLEDVFARARLQSFGDHQVLGMSPEDTFVHYATQLFNDGFRHALLRICDLHALATAGLDQDRLVAIASATGAAGITHTALSAIGLLGARLPDGLLHRLAYKCPACVTATDLLADPRWLFQHHQIPMGAVRLIRLLYISPEHRRKYLWSRLRHNTYQRGRNDPATAMLIGAASVIASILVSGGLSLLARKRSLAVNRRLRDLLWRGSRL